jgi:tRNA-binding protein
MEDFTALGIRVGNVIRAEPNSASRDPAICLWIDLGDEGVVQSSAKIMDLYDPETLTGLQVVVVTGFPSMRVGGFRSDVLVVGVHTDRGVVLLTTDDPVPPGSAVA